MEIEERFVVDQPIEVVWALFQNVPELALCLPGAELTKDNGDGSYEGNVSVKLGPIVASFDGKATVISQPDDRSIAITGRGVDRSGGSQGRVSVDVHLTERSKGSTSVEIVAAVQLAGPIAQFGRTGLVNEVSKRLIDEFSACIHAKLDAATPHEAATVKAAEVSGLSLFLSSLWAMVAKWFKRG